MSYKSFALLFLSIIGLLCALVGSILWYCSRIGEHNSFAFIVRTQLERNALYGTALNENVFAYKLELLKAKKPEIIALGSSRVLPFREVFFNTSFINAGNAMNTLNEGIDFVQSLLTFHKPKLIILGLDFWWFSESYPNYTKGEYRSITGRQISSSKIKDIFSLISKNTFFESKYIFNNDFISNPYTHLNTLGINAMYRSQGFLKDGSYLYGFIFSTQATKDSHFADTLWRIDQGVQKFEYVKSFAKERLKNLDTLLGLLNDNHIEVVVFIPPLAPEVFQTMQKMGEKYAYIDKLFDTLDKSLQMFNYHNPKKLSADSCEFIDGFHGGDIFYAKILLDMAQSIKTLETFVNTAYLSDIINTHQGRVFALDSITDFKEKDFLHLGCNK
ncbi:hypothetical protein [Helicobacter marmotae]|uniref:Uncharacterized protein n=1 Tax=Helicobacter marmotae TaxID=152490 RepID=A0A3D8I4K6_9HELI|nr:hypothetical protein [Helicobacter marmotae]RDU59471.1 hypothetical protein CQA63_06865 [Helicobacter marmotae]